jgi:selenocysteine-specific elongation factor
VTKADAVDADVLELAVEESRELVPGAEIVAVSAKTGMGVEELRAAIGRAADGVEPARADRPTRLWVDRSFSLRGVGTVVTGTLWSGSIGAGDELRLEPSGAPVRVRSVQVHDRDVPRADAGQRVAVSLPGIERREVARGEVLVAENAYPVSFRLDVALDEIEPIADGARLHVHVGTASVPARVVRVGERWAQLRLSSPVVAARGDRLVLRGETTVGGGTVLDPAPPRHRDEERIALVERGEIAATVHAPVLVSALRHVADGELPGLEQAGPWVFSPAWLAELEANLRERISAADPIDPGIAPPSEAWAADIVPLIGLERRGAKLYLPGATPSLGVREQAAKALEQELADAGVRATKVEDAELARFLAAKGTLVTLGAGYAIAAAAYVVARDVALSECRASGELTLARFRDLVGTGRRDAQLLLERFDRDGLTRRVGDARVLRRGADQALNTPSA